MKYLSFSLDASDFGNMLLSLDLHRRFTSVERICRSLLPHYYFPKYYTGFADIYWKVFLSQEKHLSFQIDYNLSFVKLYRMFKSFLKLFCNFSLLGNFSI